MKIDWKRAPAGAAVAFGITMTLVAEEAERVSVDDQYEALLKLDDSHWEKAEKLITEAEAFSKAGSDLLKTGLQRQLQKDFEKVESAYRDFLGRNPDHVNARIAFAGFLKDFRRPDEAESQLIRALATDRNNPVVWNNLADLHAGFGSPDKAFSHYQQAHELRPEEPLYLRNLGSVILKFQEAAQVHYTLDARSVQDRGLNLLRQALALAPKSFELASLLAESHDRIAPFRFEEAQKAWGAALLAAESDVQRQGVYLHLARIHLRIGKKDLARSYLDKVTLKQHRWQKSLQLKKLEDIGPTRNP